MARAQINLLAMLGEWHVYADPETLPATHCGDGGDRNSMEITTVTSPMRRTRSLTKLPESPTIEDVDIITQRMYDQTAARRKLGMRASAIVHKSFSGERYLREHEQMLWVGKAKKDMRRAATVVRQLGINAPPGHVDTQVHSSTGGTNEVSLTVGSTDSSGEASLTEKEVNSSRESGVPTEALPSLGFATSAEVTSVLTDSVSSISGGFMIPQTQWVKRSQVAIVNVRGLRGGESSIDIV
jgi:hypothetical protein